MIGLPGSGEASCTGTSKTVDVVGTYGAIFTRITRALIQIVLAMTSCKKRDTTLAWTLVHFCYSVTKGVCHLIGKLSI